MKLLAERLVKALPQDRWQSAGDPEGVTITEWQFDLIVTQKPEAHERIEKLINALNKSPH